MKYFIILLLCPLLSYAQPSDDITGVWRVVSNSWNVDTKQYADCEMIKFITDTRWASLMYWEDTGELAGSGGGTYEWIVDQYVETTEYFSWDPSAVGSKQVFEMNIQGGLLVQHGEINTDKYKYPLHTVYQKIDDLSHTYAFNDSPQGVWQLTKGTYGDEELLDKSAVKAKYGQVIKIITPNYFIGTFFNKKDKSLIGVTFGTYKVKKSKYTETIKLWSWEDKSMIGTLPTFDWAIKDTHQYQQKGRINSDIYDNYVIEENFVRIEDLQLDDKLWSEEDRQNLLSNLNRNRNEIVQLTENLSQEQWHFNPDEDSWNIAQVLEHIALYDQLVINETQKALVLPPRPEEYSFTKSDDFYTKWMGESKPHKAYAHTVPLGLINGKDNLSYFLNSRDHLNKIISSTSKDLKAHFTPRSSEAHKLRSVHGLIIVHFGHTDRHIRQIKRILTDNNFPHAN